MLIIEYDEQQDLFTIDTDAVASGANVEEGEQRYILIDAASLARLLNKYDEPHAFIGLSFSVQVHA